LSCGRRSERTNPSAFVPERRGSCRAVIVKPALTVKTKVSPAIVGAFVIGALALGIVALLSFGGVSFFAKPQRFVVYFDESIPG